jgi:UDP-N-acetylmuramoylalanine--D-glutamate ligase
MIPVTGFAGARVAVLGLGRSGLATAAALAAGGATPLLWDDSPEARAKAEADGLYALTDLSRDAVLGPIFRLLVTSPGIPHLYPTPNRHHRPRPGRASRSTMTSACSFAAGPMPTGTGWRPSPRVVAVTGSNGKSTTTALIHHILQVAGRPTQMAGNIGKRRS